MSRTDRSNEGKACDAILRQIEARERAARCNLIFPEKTHQVGPVELVCNVGPHLFAFEHTRIEPFAGHIQLEAEAERHFNPISERVAPLLPAQSRFELHLPAGAMLGLNDRDARPIRDALVNWILAEAPGLPTARPGRFILPVKNFTPPGVPFAVSLYRWERDGLPFPLIIRHVVAGDIEAERLKRIQAAYDRKMLKLWPWKKTGARAVLIFEEDDIFLANHFNVVDALLDIEKSRADRPDEIYLVSILTSRWFAVRLRIGEVALYDMQIEDRHWEADPATLINITES